MVDQELITSVRQKYDALAQEAVVIASRSPSRPCSKTSKHSSNRPLAVILSRPCDGPAKVLGIWPRRLSLRAIVSAIILWLDCFWGWITAVSHTHLRAHETDSYLVCRLLLEKQKNTRN